MLSRGARAVHRLTAAAYLGFGAALFLAPAWAAERFPWTITPFVAMTIGGWCLGVTTFSWIGGRHGPLGTMLPVLAFVRLFGLSEIVVVYLDKPAFRVDAPLAVPYILSLALTLASGGFGLLEIWHKVRAGEPLHGEGPEQATRPTQLALAGLAAVLGLLAIVVAFAGTVGPATSGKVFPEPVTLFTVRAFAALNLSMAVGALVAALSGSRSATAWLALAGVFLVGPTLLAALANLAAFDLANRPLGAVYVGGYALLLALAILEVIASMNRGRLSRASALSAR
jgi:hypothetical protein